MGLTCRIVRLQRKRLIGLPKVLLGGGYYGERYRNLSWVGFLVFIWTVTIGFVTAYNALHKFLENRKDKLVETTVRNILLDIFEQIKNLLK